MGSGFELSVSELWRDMVDEATGLGLGAILPRLIAGRVASRSTEVVASHGAPWTGGLRLTVSHIDGPTCTGEPEKCLSALLLEALVHRQGAKHLMVPRRVILRDDGSCDIMLFPFDGYPTVEP